MTYIVNVFIMSNDKRPKTIIAAHQVFIKYGYRRTTMGDLAEAAEISRPALYLLYANKEDIFRAVVTRYFDLVSERSDERVKAAACLDDKLEAAMQTWVVDPYIEVSSSPEAGEIYEAGYTFAEDLREQYTQSFAKQILHILSSSDRLDPEMIQQRACSIERVAMLMAKSSLGLKRESKDVTQLVQLLQDMCQLHLIALKI